MQNKMQIAKKDGRYYRVSMRQMRYFRIGAGEAEILLATEQAVEVPYLPFSRGDLWLQAMAAKKAAA